MCSRLIAQVNGGFTFRLGQLYNSDKKTYWKYHGCFEVMNMFLVFTVFTIACLMLPSFIRLYTDGITDVNYLMPGLPLLFTLIPILSNARCSSSYLIDYAGHFKQTVKQTLVESIINISVSVFAVVYFGIYGVLLGTVAALLYRANEMIIYTYRNIIHARPYVTYIRWISNFLVYITLYLFIGKLDLGIQDYFDWVRCALVVSAIVIIAYLSVIAVVDHNIFYSAVKKLFYRIERR